MVSDGYVNSAAAVAGECGGISCSSRKADAPLASSILSSVTDESPAMWLGPPSLTLDALVSLAVAPVGTFRERRASQSKSLPLAYLHGHGRFTGIVFIRVQEACSANVRRFQTYNPPPRKTSC